MDLQHITLLWVFSFGLIFCRIGSAVMLFPGIGESYVPINLRLIFALAVSFLLLPILLPLLPKIPTSPVMLFVLAGAEIMTGIFIGMVLRMLLSLIHVAGMIIAFQSSLASAMLFDPTQGSQGSVVGVLLTQLAVTLLFTSDLHHPMLLAIANSYHLFPAGVFPNVSDFSEFSVRLVSHGFLTAFKIAAPVLVVTTMLYLVAGIMSRLMPNMQVFFVIAPAQIYIAFLVFMVTLSAGMLWYLEYYRDALSFLDSGG